ncbi:glycoside hydrolase family 13 protein [Winogradskyella aurantia]|uniref:Alpha-amlyase n=1 Tax=Winogradskyella aurantia TaxID=1915063 RepID=A0A265UVK2_9FLAO|nr:glycoside hydrolase family 13 protein [Winogradskyella aurantia]OZV69343.1 alpha-amlyase [Winogradskyella aurantia]
MKHIQFKLSICIMILMLSCKDNVKSEMDTSQSESTIEISNDIYKIEPPHWWTGFKNRQLQLLVKHDNIGNYTAQISHQGIALKQVHKADSPNYLFLDLEIAETATPGKFNIVFRINNKPELVQTYELKKRQIPSEEYVGFNSSDAIYLITPDRFANANPENDSFEFLNEQGTDRTDGYARHGGDIQGITENLDYIKNLGFTAIWPTPLLINDMPKGSYHGYAMTDYYKVDPRFGTLDDYKTLADELRQRNMKLVMDQVANHCGLEHWWMKDLPFKDWANYQDHYLENIDRWDSQVTIHSNHRRTTNQDLYASEKDYQGMSDGWFVKDMPDLNQRNPFMANYIIQNSIWWIETLGLGGIRQDTYPYPDKEFMSNWAGAIMTEYPNFNIVGEEWSSNPLLIAYWQDGHENSDGYDSNLRSTMDFAMQEKVVAGLKNEETWGTGLKEIYVALANDFNYTRPEDIMAFPDNHDMSRIFTQLDGDITNTKMALSYLAVLPRVFQMYYGTEILMDDFAKPGDHGLIRTDFPGGWANDSTNAFTGENLAESKKDMQAFVSKLLNYRKSSEAIHTGKTMHFAPEDNTYVLARYNKEETVFHIMNKNEEPYVLKLDRFEELALNGKTLKNLMTGETVVWSDTLDLKNKGSYLFTTKLD